jgi:hypothetical protein
MFFNDFLNNNNNLLMLKRAKKRWKIAFFLLYLRLSWVSHCRLKSCLKPTNTSLGVLAWDYDEHWKNESSVMCIFFLRQIEKRFFGWIVWFQSLWKIYNIYLKHSEEFKFSGFWVLTVWGRKGLYEIWGKLKY